MAAGWTETEATHLLGRVGFGVTRREISAAVNLGREQTVDRLVTGQSIVGEPERIAPLEEVRADGKALNPDKIVDQQTYWLYRMTATQAPLIEKMTLLWHGHFATSYQKVNKVPLMTQQNELFRKYALGDFHELVLEVGKDPAMMVWLDANSNRKGKPNENYAREVMELFTLGIGNYTEDDIKEAAKSFTGWTVNRDTGEVKFNKAQHDLTVKHVLGTSGNFDERTVVDVLFKQKALPQFIARRLLTYFATPDPAQEWVDQVAADVASGPTIGDALRKLFLSDRFYAPEHRLSLIKTPAEYVAGIVKAFDLPLSLGYASSMRKMGQELYLPPDVAGWRGGSTWLMSTNLLSRYQFAESVSKKVKSTLLTSAAYKPENPNEPAAWVRLWAKQSGISELGETSLGTLAKYADDTFLHAAQKNNGMRGLLHLLMISPEAQMK